MENLILDNISLILLLPLWIFLIIMCGRFFSVIVNKSVIYFLTLLSSLLGAGICGYALINTKEPIEVSYPFLQINDFVLNFGLRIDKISLVIAVVLFIVSFAVQIFSLSYMKDDKKNYRFFALLNLFNFIMASLLFSPNLYQFYIFWELVGIVSYLLIGFEYKENIKSIASKRVFLINRVGDTALLTGIILTTFYMYQNVGNKAFVTLTFEDLNSISSLLTGYTTDIGFCIVCGLFLVAAFVKSAQFPFNTWLQEAMEAKLPVSALLHSATMVVSGVYLTIRLLPFFTLESKLMSVILAVGILTALFCSILASIETQPKKILAYSTSANLGLMFTALYFGNIKIALILLAAHAYIKSMMFILLPKENNMPKLNLILLIIGGLSLSGLIFAGIPAKEILFSNLQANRILIDLFLIISFVTAFYIIRLVGLVYLKNDIKGNPNKIELFAFLVLLFGNISLYALLRDTYHIKEPFVAAIGGMCFAILLYRHNALEKINQTPKLLERIYNNFVPTIYEKFAERMSFIDNKVLSNYKPLIFIIKKSINFVDWIEANIMNGAVKFITEFSKGMSKQDMMLQSGNVQTYNAYAFILVTLTIAFVIIGYKIILN